jgi:hypothetical protein
LAANRSGAFIPFGGFGRGGLAEKAAPLEQTGESRKTSLRRKSRLAVFSLFFPCYFAFGDII